MLDNIKKLYLYSFFQGLMFFGAVSVPFYLYLGKLNYTQIFLIEATFMAWMFILEIPTGTIADKYGRKISLFLAGVSLAIFALLFGLFPNITSFLIGNFFCALGFTLMSGADKALLYDSLKEMKKTKNSTHFFSRFALFETLALAVAFPAGSVIAGSNILLYPQILALPMLMTAVPFAFAAIIALSFKEPKRTMPDENPVLLGIKGVKYLKNHSTLRSFALDLSFISATTFFIFWLYQPAMLNAGLDIGFLGFVSAGFNLFGAFLLSRIKLLEKHIGTKRLLFLTAFVPAIAFIGLAITRNTLLTFVLVYVVASLKLLRQPLFDHHMNKYIKSSDRATVLSAISMINRIIVVFLYPVIGFLSDISIYHTFAFLGLLTLLFSFLVKVDEKYLKN